MEWSPYRRAGRTLAVAAVLMSMLTQAGCVGVVATLLYRGRLAPAACNELKEKSVAVVCIGDSGDFGPNPNAKLVAKAVGEMLDENVKKIKLVEYQRIEAWLDEHDSDYIDYVAIGKGVKADIVVAIEIEGLRLQDSQTLYKGRAEYILRVIDVAAGGKEIYAPFSPPVIYPRISGLHTASISKEEFRRKFVNVLSGDIARHFYEHDLNQQIAVDSADLQRF